MQSDTPAGGAPGSAGHKKTCVPNGTQVIVIRHGTSAASNH